MKLEIWIHEKNVIIVADGRWIEYDEGIRLIREQNGWSRKELAYKLGVSVRTIENWETGRTKNISKSTLILLKSFLTA